MSEQPKFVQITAAPQVYDDEGVNLFALDENGCVWQFDQRANNWWALSTDRAKP